MTDDTAVDASGASLGIQVHTEHEEHSDFHDHVDYASASLVSAMLCLGCGSYVTGTMLVIHQRFHDRVQEALVRASGSDYASPEEVPLF